jgi:hypothetical protein
MIGSRLHWFTTLRHIASYCKRSQPAATGQLRAFLPLLNWAHAPDREKTVAIFKFMRIYLPLFPAYQAMSSKTGIS